MPVTMRARVLGLLATGLLLAGCGPFGPPSRGQGAPGKGGAIPSVQSPTLVVPSEAAFNQPLTLGVNAGRLTAVTVIPDPAVASPGPTPTGAGSTPTDAGPTVVQPGAGSTPPGTASAPLTVPGLAANTAAAGSAELVGTIGANGASWTSTTLPLPDVVYQVHAVALDSAGSTHVLTASVHVLAVPNPERVTLTMQPNEGEVVGVGAPIVIRFDQHILDRAAVQRALVLRTTTPLVGAWHWLGDQEVRFRPERFWPTGTTVSLSVQLNGVKAGPQLWGGRDYQLTFHVGESHITHVDGVKHTVTVTVNGKVVAIWPASLGRPDFATRSGTYIVLSRTPQIQMTSCSAQITCDKTNPNYYDLAVYWDVRLTWSGTFMHAAPWSVNEQGVANVSHGCVNLSPAHAKAFYDSAQYGDIVTVSGTSRNASDLVANGDPGMLDWNMTWASYVAGSALGQPVTTLPLGG